MSATAVRTPANDIPPLENGDRLTRAEFERRYEAMPHIKKAELIEGVVYMGSPVSIKNHGAPDQDIITWLGMYKVATPGVFGGSNSTARLDEDNEPQPDCQLLILDPGRETGFIGETGYTEGPPDLVAEVASSSVSIDAGPKKRVYCTLGVKEYILWRVRDRVIDWFALRDGTYIRLEPNSDGIICSEVFPGLWLDAQAMLDARLPRVHAVLQLGIASPEHAAFVVRLQAIQKPPAAGQE